MMNYVILDLEWNGAYSSQLSGFINEIIEFGAVKLNDKREITGQFSMLVRPKLTKRLRSSVKNLTSITNEELKNGSPFLYAVNKFGKFAEGCVLMTWSTSDLITLEENIGYYCGQEHKTIPFLKRYVDLQAYCQDMMEITPKNCLGLLHAAELLGLDVDNIPHHRAVGDSMVSAQCFQELYYQPAFESYIQNAQTNTFYEKLNFHNTYLCNLDNDAIDKSVMFFNCPMCGARTRQIKDWEPKNKGFYGAFQCPYCTHRFKAKMQFKVKYDAIIPIKKILSVKEEKQKE